MCTCVSTGREHMHMCRPCAESMRTTKNAPRRDRSSTAQPWEPRGATAAAAAAAAAADALPANRHISAVCCDHHTFSES